MDHSGFTWASKSRLERQLNGPKKARNVYPTVKNQWKPCHMSSTRSLCTSGMLQKNWSECWKSCSITHQNGLKRTFSRKCSCKPFWTGDIPLVLLCIKLWSVLGGGTITVTKCIILASVWKSNSRLQRHLNGSKKARNVHHRIQKSMKMSLNFFYKDSIHIRDVAKKIVPSAENRVL
jgi:hypothetical protein